MRRNAKAILVVIIAAALLVGLFVYPVGMGGRLRPWRLGLDLVGGSHLVYKVDVSKIDDRDRDSVLNGLRDVIEKRVNLFGVAEPQVFVAKSGEEYTLIVELAGVREISQAIKQIGETPFLEFRVEDEEANNNSSSTINFIPTNLNGRYVTGAQIGQSTHLAGGFEVDITFNSEGADIFARLTEENVGKRVGIFLDGEPISIPVVQQKITGGRAAITGNFTFDEANLLVERFNAGALPAPITLVNQQTVSPTLGNDSLVKAIFAGIVGTLLVMIFMIFYYGFLGFFSTLALLIYIVLTLGVFKFVPITMTLAGLAGFILTIGMAVDANILIFERTKEELTRGLARATAIEEGFRRAWPSIRDSNISTLITAVILYYFTSSFIRGFALTLFLGVLMSMFSAITVTRTFLRVFYVNKKETKQ